MKCMRILIAATLCLGLLAPGAALAKKDKPPKTPPGQMDNPSAQKSKAAPPGLEDNPGKHKGPPEHAKAWGQRRKFQYYPDSNVYFDPGKGMYFYPDKGGWKSGKDIPGVLKSKPGASVDIELDTPTPYLYNNDHMKQYKKK